MSLAWIVKKLQKYSNPEPDKVPLIFGQVLLKQHVSESYVRSKGFVKEKTVLNISQSRSTNNYLAWWFCVFCIDSCLNLPPPSSVALSSLPVWFTV